MLFIWFPVSSPILLLLVNLLFWMIKMNLLTWLVGLVLDCANTHFVLIIILIFHLLLFLMVTN